MLSLDFIGSNYNIKSDIKYFIRSPSDLKLVGK